MGAALKVLLADVSSMDCQLLENAIQRHSSFRVIGCVTSATEAISAVYKTQPDIALISTRLQDGALAGLLLLRRLRALQLRCHVIMLLDENNPELIVEAFRNGARGIFCRTGSFRELRKCMERVREDQIWASNPQLECVVEALMRAPAPGITRPEVTTVLSKREEEVAHLVASGLSNREVSTKLGLSKHTVKNYLFRVFEKLGFSTRLELVLYMLSQTKRPVAVDDCEVLPQAQKLRA
ncbi:MAG TPA: response regulator transcription factor [Terriglobales bacterium]|nr:response regulator transcription factor [Terriglobales bacterium]